MRHLKKDIWPHCVRIDVIEESVSITDIELWLGQQLGTFKGRWNVVYQHNGTDFYFRESRDATLFALRWS